MNAQPSEWSTACPDWQDRLMAGESIFPDLPLNERSAAKALALFKRFRMPDMPEKPRFAEICSSWQFELVEALFGSYDPATRSRAISEFFVLVPKKNGKTPTAAAIMLVAILLNDRPDAEFYLISASHQIASYSFRAVKGIIKSDPEIERLFHIRDHLKRIEHIETGAVLAIVSADGDVVTGSKASGILIDEMHVLGAKPRAAEILAELRGGFAARPEGFLLTITTQSKEPPAGEFKKELSWARRVRDGEEQAPLLPVLYEFPPKLMKNKAWENPDIWGAVNPNLGVSVSTAFLEEQFRKAKKDGPAALALFASLHLNVEIGVGLGGEWMAARFWEKAGDQTLTLDEIIARSDVAVMGVDGGGLDDLLGAAVIGRCAETRQWLGWVHAWAHPEVLRQRKEIAPRLQDFAEAADLTILEEDDPTGDVIGVADVAERLKDAQLLPDAGAIGLDPWGVSAIVDELALREIEDGQVVAVGQGARLSPAIWGMERKLKDGTLRHCGQPIMGWCMGNVKIEQRGSAVTVTKQAAGRAKIDPVIAMLNAFMLISRNPVAGGSDKEIVIPAGYKVA
ncbi:terminase large subunit [Mameliella sp.]|uniref:terminase large subunit n=1 Tax=Mameliella sp. TaxID=1924940 RepID=UPI003B50583B